jgi:predicted transposase/invertase (TIGR01784 family)
MATWLEQMIEENTEVGYKKGKAEGKAETSHDIALTMLKKGVDINLISEYTGLPKKEIRKLAESIQ